MDEYGEIFETFIEPDDITYDLMDVKEIAKINGIIQKLRLYDNKPEELTKVYSSILLDDNVAYILIKVSQDKILEIA